MKYKKDKCSVRPIMLLLGRLRQDDWNFKASLNETANKVRREGRSGGGREVSYISNVLQFHSVSMIKHCTSRSQSALREIRAGTWREPACYSVQHCLWPGNSLAANEDQQERWGTLLADWFTGSCLTPSLCSSGPHAQWMALPTAGCALLYQLTVKKYPTNVSPGQYDLNNPLNKILRWP